MNEVYIVIKNILSNDFDYLHRDFLKGQTVTRFSGPTYGCISPKGIAIVDEGDSFLELPVDCLAPECRCEDGVACPSLTNMNLEIDGKGFGMDTICETCEGYSDSYVDIDTLINRVMDADCWVFSDWDQDMLPTKCKCKDVWSCKINKNVAPRFENHENRTFCLVGVCVNGCRMEFHLRNWFGNEIDDDENYPIRSVGDTYFRLFLRDLATVDYHNRLWQPPSK